MVGVRIHVFSSDIGFTFPFTHSLNSGSHHEFCDLEDTDTMFFVTVIFSLGWLCVIRGLSASEAILFPNAAGLETLFPQKLGPLAVI